jgi:hypothetical protein
VKTSQTWCAIRNGEPGNPQSVAQWCQRISQLVSKCRKKLIFATVRVAKRIFSIFACRQIERSTEPFDDFILR